MKQHTTIITELNNTCKYTELQETEVKFVSKHTKQPIKLILFLKTAMLSENCELH